MCGLFSFTDCPNLSLKQAIERNNSCIAEGTSPYSPANGSRPTFLEIEHALVCELLVNRPVRSELQTRSHITLLETLGLHQSRGAIFLISSQPSGTAVVIAHRQKQ